MSRDVSYFPPREYRDARAWSLASDQLFESTPIVPSDTAGAFRLRAEMLRLGMVRLAHLESGPYLNERFPVGVSQVDPIFILDLQRAGRSRIEQNGQVTEIGPGDFSLTDASRPYRREYLDDRNQVLVMQFPQQMLTLPPKALAHIVGTSFSGSSGLAAILSRFLGGIADGLSALQDPLGLTMVDSVIDVVSTLITGQTAVGGEAGDSAWQLLEIRDYIMENLGDPELSPERVAKANYISLRHLHALFAKSGSTVAAWIRDRRLEMCRRELSDPRASSRTVREISNRWGFSNQTYFAKVFRATYGYSPTAARRGDSA